ncbi:unannotated protein [freshwater metagenome]|uniref:Unannotated protein n=1 Tax=freshwater metagenome TaxID=449393 RepID=A0A6J7S9T1_9ZZZZ
MSAVKKFSLLFCVLFVALTFTPGAQAHSSLVDSSPKVGESLNKLPQEISLRFDEEIQDLEGANAIVVRDSNGVDITTGPTLVVSAYVSKALELEGRPGIYEVSYRIVSADGHVVTAGYKFTLLPASTPSATPLRKRTEAPVSEASSPTATATPSSPVTLSTPPREPTQVIAHEVHKESFIHVHAKHTWIVVGILVAGLLWFLFENLSARNRQERE